MSFPAACRNSVDHVVTQTGTPQLLLCLPSVVSMWRRGTRVALFSVIKDLVMAPHSWGSFKGLYTHEGIFSLSLVFRASVLKTRIPNSTHTPPQSDIEEGLAWVGEGSETCRADFSKS